jgi:hypothetical protein
MNPSNSDSFWRALKRVYAASDAKSSLEATYAVLDAVGNNHAGTYGSEVFRMVPALGSVLREGAPWSQHAALEALIDLTGSFEPDMTDPEFGNGASSGKLVSLARMHLPEIERLASTSGVVADSASVLLEALSDRP